MRRAIAVALLLLLPAVIVAQESKKRPIPSKDAQAKIEMLLQELFKDDFAKADKDAVLRGQLAQKLLFEGKETKDDAAGRYVLFSKAHALAAQAGDVNTALQAIDELANDFAIPAGMIFQMKIAMLQQASNAVGASPEAYQSVIDRAMVILEDTLDSDDYVSSLALIAAAEQAGRKLKSIVLVSAIRKKQEEIVRLQKEFARWQPFADKLAKNPKDAEANLEMGKYHALVKGNWERGLPMMAVDGSSRLGLVARDELSARTNGLSLVAAETLATSWYLQSERLDASMKTQALLRAQHWFQESLSLADDKERATIETSLRKIDKLLPAEYRIGEITIEVKKIELPGPVYSCAFAPDGKRIIATGYDGSLRLFNAKTYKEIRTLEGHAGKVWAVAFSANGKHAISGGFDSTVRLWNLESQGVKTFEGHKDYVRSVAISADGQWIFSGGDDRTVRMWNVGSGKEERVMPGHDHSVWCVALSRDGKRGLSASLDKTVRYWDLEKGETIRKLEGHTDTVLCVAFSPDGQHAVTGSSDKTLRLWNLADGKTLQIFEGSAGYIHSVAISPDGRRILSAGSDNLIRLWDAQTGKEIRKLEGHRDQVWHVAFSRDGRFALSSGQDFSVRVWAGAR
jgi:WD domain, G-beta repeat